MEAASPQPRLLRAPAVVVTEFMLGKATYFIEQKITREKVELAAVSIGEGCGTVRCFRGAGRTDALKPEGFRIRTYIETLQKALRVQDAEGDRFTYDLREEDDGSGLTFSVRFKVADTSGIFVLGAELFLSRVQGPPGAFLQDVLRRASISTSALCSALDTVKQLTAERDRYAALAESAAALKAAAEVQLLEMAAKVLNAKKAKVKSLLQENGLLQGRVASLSAQLDKAKGEAASLEGKVREMHLQQQQRPPPSPPRPPKPVPDSSVDDSYPDFTTLKASPAARSRKPLFPPSSPVRQAIPRSCSDVSRTSGGSSKKRKAGPGTPSKKARAETGFVSAQELLDSD